MRTLALIKVNSIRGALLGVILLLALMMFFVIGAKPSHAADLKGDYTINAGFTNVTSLPADDKLKPTNFKLYKVGSFISGEPYVELDSPYDKMDVQLPLEVDKDNVEAWTTAWLYCANTLKTKIPADTNPDRTFKSSEWVDGKCTFEQKNLENGLYLLVGDSQKVTGYPSEGQNSYWWPQPMLVSILNGNVEISLKPMYGSASHLKVTKVWQGIPAELSDLVLKSLESIDIEIYYQAEENEEKVLRYTKTLSDDNNWTFEWDPEPGEGDPSKWTAVEVIDENAKPEFDKNFSVSYAPFTQVDHQGDDGDYFASTITNKYDRYELEILKTFDAYIDNGEGNSTSLVFELSGYSDEAKENRVYHKFVGLQVDKSKGDVQKLDVKDIPRGLALLMVKEVDSGNYKPDDAEKKAELVTSEDDPKGVYKVSFNNSLDNTTHGSGVINKFKIVKKDNKPAYEFDKSLGNGK